MDKNFSNAIKSDFFHLFPDLSIFDVGFFNLVRPMQIGFEKSVMHKELYNFSDKYPLLFPAYIRYSRVKALLRIKKDDKEELKKLQELSGRPYFMMPSNKWLKKNDGEFISVHFNKLIHLFGRENCILSLLHWPPNIKTVNIDFKAGELAFKHSLTMPFDKDDRILIKGIYRMLKNLYRKKNKEISQHQYNFMHVAAEMFWLGFRYWKYVIGIIRPKAGFILGVYRHEEVIAAFKYHHIPIAEIQHGLKSPEDMYIGYPESIIKHRNKALFVDVSFVYGNYWKKQLLRGYEYLPEQIKTIGYYIDNIDKGSDIKKKISLHEGKKIISIISQPQSTEILADYIEWLANDILHKKQFALIVVKLHPSEDGSVFKTLEEKYQNVIVLGRDYSIMDLFAVSSLCIGVYSLALFDATMYGIPVFIYNMPEYKHYIDDIMNSGIAELINGKENPLDKVLAGNYKVKYKSEYFYEDFYPEQLKTIVEELCIQ